MYAVGVCSANMGNTMVINENASQRDKKLIRNLWNGTETKIIHGEKHILLNFKETISNE